MANNNASENRSNQSILSAIEVTINLYQLSNHKFINNIWNYEFSFSLFCPNQWQWNASINDLSIVHLSQRIQAHYLGNRNFGLHQMKRSNAHGFECVCDASQRHTVKRVIYDTHIRARRLRLWVERRQQIIIVHVSVCNFSIRRLPCDVRARNRIKHELSWWTLVYLIAISMTTIQCACVRVIRFIVGVQCKWTPFLTRGRKREIVQIRRFEKNNYFAGKRESIAVCRWCHSFVMCVGSFVVAETEILCQSSVRIWSSVCRTQVKWTTIFYEIEFVLWFFINFLCDFALIYDKM